jgi:NADPH:quinone reductase-like Zn-dependent oxidoreductase
VPPQQRIPPVRGQLIEAHDVSLPRRTDSLLATVEPLPARTLALMENAMKAIVQDRYGSPDVLQLREIDQPTITADDVLVEVRAAALNAYDWHFLRGDPYLARLSFGLRAPKSPVIGRDFAGRVEAVGANVTRFRPGDEVYGEVDGSLAEHVAVPARAVAPKPAGLTFEQAAAVPLAGNTALICLRAAKLQPGQHILINGASGGVGTFAVQLASAFGAAVTGVCSPRNIDLVKSLGADSVLNYTEADFAQESQRFDVVLDLVGNRTLADLRKVLTPKGTLILSGGGVSGGGSLFGPLALFLRARLVSGVVRHRILQPMASPNGENLLELRQLIESGQVRPVIDRTYPLSRTAEAMRYLEDEHARAKVVITV